MSTTDSYPRQVSLPGQAAVAEGPYDQTGMYVMHHAFRRDLARFESAVRRTPPEEAATWKLLQHRWRRVGEVLHHHHRVEDEAFWPVLMRHAEEQDDTEARRMLLDMEAEHAGIDPALALCEGAFADMVEHPCEDHRQTLDLRITTVRASLLDHLRHEETDALAMVQRTMTPEEFAATEKAAQRGYPMRMMAFLLPWVMSGVPDEPKRRVLEDAGPVYGLLLRLFEGRFRKADERVWRHA
jgi:Hemerythrin HHE cation binding domain